MTKITSDVIIKGKENKQKDIENFKANMPLYTLYSELCSGKT